MPQDMGAFAAERASSILEARRNEPAEAALMSGPMAEQKARLEPMLMGEGTSQSDLQNNEGDDASPGPQDMDRFLSYLSVAQREQGTADADIEMIPKPWARQIRTRFEAALATKTANRFETEAAIMDHYTQLHKIFDSRTDDVIAYSLVQ